MGRVSQATVVKSRTIDFDGALRVTEDGMVYANRFPAWV